MKIAGSTRINASRERVYAALNDIEILRRAIPGCERLEREPDGRLSAAVALKIGPVQATFEGEVVLSDLNPPESYTIAGSGKGGVAGFASGSAAVRLAEDAGATVLSYEADAKVGGKMAQIGSRLIEGTARKLAGQFFDRFGEAVEGDGEGGGEDPPDEPESASAAASAPARARRILGWVWGAALLAAAAVAFYLWRMD